MNSSTTFHRRGLATLAVALAGTLILAGCGSSDSDSDSSYTSTDSGSTAAKTSYGGDKYGSQTSNSTEGSMAGGAAVISTASVGELGKILVDSKGMTLYYFKKDKNGKSACYGACAQAWPPVTTDGNPVARNGAMAGKLGTTMRNDGSTQVTYAGWPLYLYAGDSKPGQANGNDITQFGAQWYALTPSGQEPDDG